MALISAYPALVLGLLAGMILARRRSSVLPTLVAGTVVFALLVAQRSAGPAVVSGEGGGSMTPLLWLVLALVNAGAWCLGIGMGVAVARPRVVG